MPSKNSQITGLLLSCTIIEIGCHSFWLDEGNKELISIGYFLMGILIATLPLIKTEKKQNKIFDFAAPSIFNLLLLTGLIVLIFMTAGSLFGDIAVKVKTADMLPVIEIMCQRFLDGSPVYEVIEEVWGGMPPFYLPAMWVPFLPTSFLDLDPRWTTTVALTLSVLLILFSSASNNKLIVWIPILMLVFGVMYEDVRAIAMSQEFVVVFYYLLLGFAVFKKDKIWIAIALMLCALSRYFLLPWAVMYLAYLFFFEQKKQALQIGGISAILGLLLLLAFQGFTNLWNIINLQGHYLSEVLAKEWKYKILINNNLGIAKFFNYDDLGQLHSIHLLSSFLIPALLFFLYGKYRHQINQPFFAICSLKICLVFFYNLLILPYLYLFYTSTFLSILIFSLYVNNGNEFKQTAKQ